VSAAFFVDCHSHVVPSGDDGAATIAEGWALCHGAARHGTRLLFATPHVWPQLPLTRRREEEVRRSYAAVAAQANLELRLGFELTPTAELLAEDPRRYRLAGTEHVLMEVPFAGRADPLFALAEHTERAGLQPVIAHPERAEAVLADPDVALELAERGWLLQLNATSLIGYHGAHVEALAWQLVEDGHAAIVASDGHRSERPPQLDRAYAIVRARLGEARACSLFDGSALGLGAAETAASARTPSRAASRGA
jgi:protein-tyrosine phosphatase